MYNSQNLFNLSGYLPPCWLNTIATTSIVSVSEFLDSLTTQLSREYDDKLEKLFIKKSLSSPINFRYLRKNIHSFIFSVVTSYVSSTSWPNQLSIAEYIIQTLPILSVLSSTRCSAFAWHRKLYSSLPYWYLSSNIYLESHDRMTSLNVSLPLIFQLRLAQLSRSRGLASSCLSGSFAEIMDAVVANS